DPVVVSCLKGLQQLSPEPSVASVAASLRLLRRLEAQPAARELRQLTSAALARQMGRRFQIAETQSDLSSLERAYAPLFRCAEQHWPAAMAQLRKPTNSDVA